MAPAHIENVSVLTRGISQARKQELSQIEDLESYYLGVLAADCRKRVEQLYTGRLVQEEMEGEALLIAKMISLRSVEEEYSRSLLVSNTDNFWRIDSMQEVTTDFRAPFLGSIIYYPIATICKDGKVYMAMLIESKVAQKYLPNTYERAINDHKPGSQGFLINPNYWDPEHGEVVPAVRPKVLRAFPEKIDSFKPKYSKFSDRELQEGLSLVIACDLTETQFGQGYIEATRFLEEE